MRLPFIALALAGLSGCTMAPTVEYTKLTQVTTPPADIIDSIFLQKTEIIIKQLDVAEKDNSGEAPPLDVSSVPAENTSFRLVIRKADPFYADTNLNISKIANTDLVKEIGAEVKDYRVDAVKVVGAVAALAIGFSDAKVQEHNLPYKIDVNEALKGTQREAKEVVVEGTGIGINFGEVPFDARPISDLNTPLKTSGAVYAACRSARVRFTSSVTTTKKLSKGEVETSSKTYYYDKTVKVSDPRYFQIAAFPAKGKVTFHDQCGVSVTSQSDTGQSSVLAITDALVAQGKAIKDAIEAAKKKEDK